MAAAPKVVDPPFYDQPIVDSTSGQQHSQAWTEYHQSVADQLAVLSAKAQTSQGVTDGSDAAAGQVGEYLTASSSGSVGLGTGAVVNIATLPLTAGDWDVQGNIIFNPTGAATYAAASVNTASAALGPVATRVPGAGGGVQMRIGTGGTFRVSVSAAATAYLVAQTAFTSGAMTATGALWARRVR
jgi:hypothetical protein